jgi:hypothetical protein
VTLYVSDLDGTLLDPQAQLSELTRAGLVRLLDEGLVFTVASARHVTSIRKILGDLPLRLPVISSNGAYISDMKTGRHELVNAMPPALGQDIVALMQARGFTPFASTHGPQGDQLFVETISNLGQQHFIDQRTREKDERLRRCTRLLGELGDPAVTVVLIDRKEALLDLQAALIEQFGDAVETHVADDLYQPDWPWMSVHDRRASKDQAIATLAERYGLAAREIVVFGDHVNDVSMLRAAHRGIAMGNAIEAVKREAQAVIGHHADDSVLRFIDADWRRSVETKPR